MVELADHKKLVLKMGLKVRVPLARGDQGIDSIMFRRSLSSFNRMAALIKRIRGIIYLATLGKAAFALQRPI